MVGSALYGLMSIIRSYNMFIMYIHLLKYYMGFKKRKRIVLITGIGQRKVISRINCFIKSNFQKIM